MNRATIRATARNHAASEALKCPVTIRGKYYPSQKDAAQDFGIRSSSFAYHFKRYGHLDNVGLNVGRVGNSNGLARPVSIFGHDFKSIKAAAREFGVSETMMRRFVNGEASAKTCERVLGKMMESAQ